MATNCVSVHGTYSALEPSLDGEEPTAFKAVVLSFVEKKRAELIIPNDWFQDPCRYGGISELIWLAVQSQSSRNIPHIIFFLSQDSIKMATEAGTESNFLVLFLSVFIISQSDEF